MPPKRKTTGRGAEKKIEVFTKHKGSPNVHAGVLEVGSIAKGTDEEMYIVASRKSGSRYWKKADSEEVEDKYIVSKDLDKKDRDYVTKELVAIGLRVYDPDRPRVSSRRQRSQQSARQLASTAGSLYQPSAQTSVRATAQQTLVRPPAKGVLRKTTAGKRTAGRKVSFPTAKTSQQKPPPTQIRYYVPGSPVVNEVSLWLVIEGRKGYLTASIDEPPTKKGGTAIPILSATAGSEIDAEEKLYMKIQDRLQSGNEKIEFNFI